MQQEFQRIMKDFENKSVENKEKIALELKSHYIKYNENADEVTI